MKNNEGIIITGGELNADQLAVGKSATINIASTMRTSDLIERVDALLSILDANKSDIKNYNDVKKAGEVIKDELVKENPDKKILSILLSRISDSAPVISSITESVNFIKEGIELFIK